MLSADDRILFENEAYRLTATGLQQNNGLSAELEGVSTLRISRNGDLIKTVNIPEPPPGYTGMRSSIPALTAMYNLAIKELRANIHKGGLMLAGANWSTVWTRDIAYAAALGATLTEPSAVRNSLCSRVRRHHHARHRHRWRLAHLHRPRLMGAGGLVPVPINSRS